MSGVCIPMVLGGGKEKGQLGAGTRSKRLRKSPDEILVQPALTEIKHRTSSYPLA
jgi:hypothetical protein